MDKNIWLATAALLFVSALVGMNGIYQPKKTQLTQMEQAVQQEEELDSLAAEVSSLEKRLQTYSHRLMEKGKEETELIDRVREIANGIPVRVLSMKPSTGSKQAQQGLLLVSLQLTLEGSYHQLGAFVAKVENSEKFMRVDSIRFTTPTAASSKSIVFELEISTIQPL